MNKYKINDVVNFIHGTQVVKGVIDEYILHHTQNEVIIKYIIRPYGLKDFVTINADKIYADFEQAKQFVINDITNKYTKENIKREYKATKKQMDKKYKKDMQQFDTNMKVAINTIRQLDENYYNQLEVEYQKQLEQK